MGGPIRCRRREPGQRHGAGISHRFTAPDRVRRQCNWGGTFMRKFVMTTLATFGMMLVAAAHAQQPAATPPSPPPAPPPYGPSITLDQAKKAIAAAEEEAK